MINWLRDVNWFRTEFFDWVSRWSQSTLHKIINQNRFDQIKLNQIINQVKFNQTRFDQITFNQVDWSVYTPQRVFKTSTHW